MALAVTWPNAVTDRVRQYGQIRSRVSGSSVNVSGVSMKRLSNSTTLPIKVDQGPPSPQGGMPPISGAALVLKDRGSIYRADVRSAAWPKPKLTLTVTGGSSERVPWGDWGEAAMLEFRYTHPRTGAVVEIRHTVRVPRGEPLDVQIGKHAELICWRVMPSGMLRHPVFVEWRA